MPEHDPTANPDEKRALDERLAVLREDLARLRTERERARRRHERVLEGGPAGRGPAGAEAHAPADVAPEPSGA